MLVLMKRNLLVVLFTICVSTFFINAQELSSQKFGFSFYPNPATTEINVNLLNNSGEAYTLGIYNAIGDLVYSQLLDPSETKQSLHLDLSNFQSGMYIIQLNGKEDKLTHKLIVK